MKIYSRFALSIPVVLFLTLTASVVKAVPYAGEVTNNGGIVV